MGLRCAEVFHVETNWREETRGVLRYVLEPTATDRNEPFPICPLRYPVLLDGDDFASRNVVSKASIIIR